MTYLIPEQLETERLRLRMFVEEDWRDLYPLYSDEETVRFTTRRVLNEGEIWRTMAMLVGHWQLRGYGPYALEEKESGKVLGYTGLWYPGEWPEPELAWALNRQYWGKGFASEAARGVKTMTTSYLPDLQLISLIDKQNRLSRKVAEALGAKLEKEIIFKGEACLIYRHGQEQD